MESDCIFCQIVAGKVPSEILYQDEEVIAFRDINPQAPKHLLIIPKKHKAVYLASIGGAGALLAKSIKQIEVVAYEDLGAEAILWLNVDNFPAIVANDIYGNDLFEQGKARYQRNK